MKLHPMLMFRRTGNNCPIPGAILLLIIATGSNGLILRLPCKQMANFNILSEGKVLEGWVIALFTNLTEQDCQVKCLFNWDCKSFNTEHAGDRRCQLNSKTTEDLRDNATLISKAGWSFATTDYTNPWIGENCRNLKPCKDGVLCTDSCECPGYRCNECSGKAFGLHCYEALKDCEQFRKSGVVKSGVYPLIVAPNKNISVFCDFSTKQTAWIVIQRRVDASTDFNRDWSDYKNGFGDPNGNYWIGLDKINLLAGPGRGAELRIDMKHNDSPSRVYYAQYSKFEVGNETEQYVLSVGGYYGDAGDSLSNCEGDFGYGCSTRMKFSTKDRDNDLYSDNCADKYNGGWWFNNCLNANLNSLYAGSLDTYMTWFSLNRSFGGIIYSEMKIKYD